MTVTSTGLTDDQLAVIITEQLPRLLETRPAVRQSLYRTLVKFLTEEGLLDRFERKVEESRQGLLAAAAVDVAVEQQRERSLTTTVTNASLTNTPLTDDQLAVIITEQLPRLLETRPAVRQSLCHTLVKLFAEEGFSTVSIER